MTDKSKTKRILLWIIPIIFTGVCIWWVFYSPYNPELLYRAVPEDALFVSEHENLAERLDTIPYTPLGRIIFGSMGLDEEDIDKSVNNPIARGVISKIAAKNTVVAYVPETPAYDPTTRRFIIKKETWVFASWMGAYGRLLRWGGLRLGLDLNKERLYDGRLIWVEGKRRHHSDHKLSFAVVEGVLLTCYSPDPRAVQYLIRAIEKKAPLQPQLKQRLNSAASLQPAEPEETGRKYMDRGWQVLLKSQTGFSDNITLTYKLDLGNTNLTEGTITANHALLPPRSLKECEHETLRSTLGNAPDALAIMPYEYLSSLLSGNYGPKGFVAIKDLLKQRVTDNSLAFIGFFSGNYSGRLAVIKDLIGMKIPTLMIGVQLNEDPGVLDAINKTIETLNVRYEYSLISQRTKGYPSLIVLDDAKKNGALNYLAPGSKPALMVENGWLILATSESALKNLLKKDAIPEFKAGNGQIEWVKGLLQNNNTYAYAWLDLDSIGRTLKSVVAVWSLSDAKIHKHFDSITNCIDALRTAKTGHIRLNTDDFRTELQFRLGK
ncbi:hypothetical protein ACFLS1_12340 [Verrucomicrobiota bacterium]